MAIFSVIQRHQINSRAFYRPKISWVTYYMFQKYKERHADMSKKEYTAREVDFT